MSESDFLFRPVGAIKGVGESYRKYLANLGITKILDLYFHFPSGLLVRKKRPKLTEVMNGEYVTIELVVDAHIEPHISLRKRVPYRVSCHNDSGFIDLVFFNAFPEFVKKNLPEGNTRLVSGKIEFFNGKAQMSHPDYIVPLEKENEIPVIEPLYPLTAGITQKNLRKIILEALEKIPLLPEWISAETIKKKNWPSWQKSIKGIHNPTENINENYRKRLAFDEILALQLFLEMSREKIHKIAAPKIKPSQQLTKQFLDSLPFELTISQQKVFAEISEDLARGRKMMRLLQGDVGSGKTVVAALACLPIFSANSQVALMAPTEILANQHYKFFLKYFVPLGFKVELLTGRMSAAEKKRIAKDLAKGATDMVIGTHALFQTNVEYKALGLIVIDEQHRFGVMQRKELAEKGNAHVLMMSATPIPRTLAMTLYGDMDISIIAEKPKERLKIDTRVVSATRIEEVLLAMKRALDAHDKIYWICPLIDESEKSDLIAAEKRFQTFEKIFPGQVGLIHGRIKSEAREEIMQKFIEGEINILVATTVIEVGVDVPDASIIVIENSERFGLSQLHQLRGRVGRGNKKSSCLLLYNEVLSEESKRRLKILKNSDDGFYIAEEDLKLRGAGELIGKRQSGFQEFKIADMAVDYELIMQAKAEAAKLIKNPSSAIALLLKIFGYEEEKAKIEA